MCAASLGMWQVLLESGIDVSTAGDCSAGSIFAAMIAMCRDFETAKKLTLLLCKDFF